MHKVLATHLVKAFGVELIDAEYTGPEYHGEVAMHIALVNKDVEVGRSLVRVRVSVRVRVRVRVRVTLSLTLSLTLTLSRRLASSSRPAQTSSGA